VVIAFFWLRLDHLIKPCFLSASPLLSLYIALAFAHVTSRSLQIPTPLPTSHITCMPSCAHAFPCFTYLSVRFLHSAYYAFSSHTLRLSISLCMLPVYLSYLIFLVLCAVAVPCRVKCVCLRHSGLGAARPDILPHQQCC
jgi:hypothetical protein